MTKENNKNTQSRKWQITINNPRKHGFDHEKIKEQLSQFKSLCYWCMSDEIGENGTYHTHIYMAFNSAARFNTIKKKFPPAFMAMAKGTSQQNRDYITKEGKWEKDKKKETNLPETFEEYGSMPIERQGQRNDLHDLYDMIKNGLSNFEIMEEDPSYILQIDKIDRARQIVMEAKYRNVLRKNLEVIYVFGTSGTGKTRMLYEDYGEDLYRVTDFKHPFDSYRQQSVIAFEEFRSSLKISDMLNYLDIYPLELPCRYNNKVACYEKVIITTNIPLEAQFKEVQNQSPETWNAFLRRIDKIKEYTPTGIEEYSIEEFKQRQVEKAFIPTQEEIPDNVMQLFTQESF